jgi:hypothetical protein
MAIGGRGGEARSASKTGGCGSHEDASGSYQVPWTLVVTAGVESAGSETGSRGDGTAGIGFSLRTAATIREPSDASGLRLLRNLRSIEERLGHAAGCGQLLVTRCGRGDAAFHRMTFPIGTNPHPFGPDCH